MVCYTALIYMAGKPAAAGESRLTLSGLSHILRNPFYIGYLDTKATGRDALEVRWRQASHRSTLRDEVS